MSGNAPSRYTVIRKLARRQGAAMWKTKRGRAWGADAFAVPARERASADNERGFHESSLELQSGLEVSEEAWQTLPPDVAREFLRLRAADAR
jgi:hypothetical protein